MWAHVFPWGHCCQKGYPWGTKKALKVFILLPADKVTKILNVSDVTDINRPTFFKIANCWKPFWIKTNIFSLGKVVDFPTHVFTVTSIYRAILTACCLFHQDSYFDYTGKSLAMIAVGGRHSEQSLWLWFMFHGYDMVCQPISVRTQY